MGVRPTIPVTPTAANAMKIASISLILLVWVLGAGAGAARASAPPDKCGNIDAPAELLAEAYAPAFHESESADWRASLGIQTLPEGTTGSVVTDQAVCRRVMREAVEIFRRWPHWRDLHRNGYEFQVYRIGPYYAVHESDLPPPGVVSLTYHSNLLIFRADTLAYVGALSYQM